MTSRLPSESAIAQAVIQKTLAEATKMEAALDASLDRMNNLSQDDIDNIRRKRLKELKERAEKEKVASGHPCALCGSLLATGMASQGPRQA